LQILQVTAVDLDTGNNARLSYRLQGSGAFRISPNTGWIYLAQNLDRETLDRHALTVLATDNGSPAATASTSVLITVLDDNDNDPRFEKDFYGFELLENLPSSTLVGSVSATDPDLGKNSLLRYAIVQANSSFAVDPDTGKEPAHPFPIFPPLSSRPTPSIAQSTRLRSTTLSSVCPSRAGIPHTATRDAHANSSAEKNISEPFPRVRRVSASSFEISPRLPAEVRYRGGISSNEPGENRIILCPRAVSLSVGLNSRTYRALLLDKRE